MRLYKLVSVLGHEPGRWLGLQVKNDVSKGVTLKVVAVNARENDCTYTGLLRNPRGWLDVQLNLPAFAIDLVADKVVIME